MCGPASLYVLPAVFSASQMVGELWSFKIG